MNNNVLQNTVTQNAQKRNVLPDSSSLILLQSAGILEIVCHHYNILIAPAVFQEIAEVDKPGAEDFVRLYKRQSFELIKSPDNHYPVSLHKDLQRMGKGEGQILSHILGGCGEFIIVDDLQAAKFCVGNTIPFINALLVPRILLFAGLISTESAEESFSAIRLQGRYSHSILKRAVDLQRSDLQTFFP